MSWRTSLRLFAVAGVAAAALAGGAPGCSKEKESLILVQVVATSSGTAIADPGITDVEIALLGTDFARSRIFDLPATGLPATGAVFGVYVPASVRGTVRITATARRGGDCTRGYTGMGRVEVAGGDSPSTTVMVHSENVCGLSGTGGSGGSIGAAGTGGAGTAGTTGTGGSLGGTGGGMAGTDGACTGTPGSLPSLTCCRQFDHLAIPAACDLNDTFIYNIAFSPDGTKLLTGGDDGRVKVWNFDGRTPTATGTDLPATSYGLFAIAPNGMNVAVGNAAAVDIYETSTWTRQRTLTAGGSTIYGVGFAPDSARVFSVDSGDRVFIHSITNVTALANVIATVFNNGISVAPTQLASGLGVAVFGTDGDVSLYSVTGTSTFGSETFLFASPSYLTTTAAFSPDGTLLAVGDGDSFLRFWNFPLPSATTAPTGNTISIGSTGGITDNILSVAFSPNGQHIAVAGGYNQGSISIWNVASRSMVSRYNFPAGRIGLSVAFSPSGTAVAVGEVGCGKFVVCSD